MNVQGTLQQTSGDRANMAIGSFVTPAGAVAITVILGFRPRRVELINVTTPARWTKTASMAANAAAAEAGVATTPAATQLTINTSSAITITDNGFVLASAVAGAAQTWHYTAQN